MVDSARPFSPQIVTMFGGSGFLGRYVVQALARRNYRIRVAVRRPNLAGHVQPIGDVGQIHAVQANLRFPSSIQAAIQGASAVVNLVGILQESGRQTFDAVQADGARTVAEAAAAAGARIVHVSAIGADPASKSAYARTKAAGEAVIRQARSDAVIFRPSVIFGPGDSFFNRFAALARVMPVLPLAGADTRFQPVYAADVSEAIGRSYLVRFRRSGQFDIGRDTAVASNTPDVIAPTSMGPASDFHPERGTGPAAGHQAA